MRKITVIAVIAFLIISLLGCGEDPYTPDVQDISITSPAYGSVQYGEITVSVSVNNSEITSVKFYVNSSYKMDKSASPYRFYFDTTPYNNSTITLMVRGYSASGALIAESNPVQIAVDSGTAIPE